MSGSNLPGCSLPAPSRQPVCLQRPPQMARVQNHEMVQALPSY
jgi:hypothetical protein